MGSVTRTSEDVLRKLREDPLFQIKKQEQVAREQMLSNPLVMAKVKQQQAKRAKKEAKRAKKEVKKEKKKVKKHMKKEIKNEKKRSGHKKKKSSSSSSGSSDTDSSSDREVAIKREATSRATSRGNSSRCRAREGSASPRQGKKTRVESCHPGLGSRAPSLRHLGPDSNTVDQREERAKRVAEQRDAALASRGATKRLNEEEKRQRLEEMQRTAARHEAHKDRRIADAELKAKEQDEADLHMRRTSDQKFFRGMREQAYMQSEGSVADRLKSQRHRRQKHLNDPLERTG